MLSIGLYFFALKFWFSNKPFQIWPEKKKSAVYSNTDILFILNYPDLTDSSRQCDWQNPKMYHAEVV